MNKTELCALLWVIGVLYFWRLMNRELAYALLRRHVFRYGIDGKHWLKFFWISLAWHLPGGKAKQLAHLKKIVEETLNSGEIFRNGRYCNFFIPINERRWSKITGRTMGTLRFDFESLRENNNYEEIGGAVIESSKEFWFWGLVFPLLWPVLAPIIMIGAFIAEIPFILAVLFDNIGGLIECIKESFSRKKP